MNKLIHWMMLSCQKASELFEKKQLFPLSNREAFQLWMHSKVCKACQGYQKESKQIDTLLAEQKNDSYAEETLSKEFKEHLIKTLNQ